MCHVSVQTFVQANLTGDDVKGKRVLEVGSYNVNGSPRKYLLSLKPKSYMGVDMRSGPGVDKVCNACDLVEEFGEKSFDLVVSTEMLEHVKKWRRAISNMKRVLDDYGVLLITTRSKGFGYHGYPSDFWRYEPDDMKVIFSDMHILVSERDPERPGVLFKAKRLPDFHEVDLSKHELYAMSRKR